MNETRVGKCCSRCGLLGVSVQHAAALGRGAAWVEAAPAVGRWDPRWAYAGVGLLLTGLLIALLVFWQGNQNPLPVSLPALLPGSPDREMKTWSDLMTTLAGGLGSLSLLLAGWAAWDRHRNEHAEEPVQRAARETVWSRLHYCGVDDRVFDPETGDEVPAQREAVAALLDRQCRRLVRAGFAPPVGRLA